MKLNGAWKNLTVPGTQLLQKSLFGFFDRLLNHRDILFGEVKLNGAWHSVIKLLTRTIPPGILDLTGY